MEYVVHGCSYGDSVTAGPVRFALNRGIGGQYPATLVGTLWKKTQRARDSDLALFKESSPWGVQRFSAGGLRRRRLEDDKRTSSRGRVFKLKHFVDTGNRLR